MIRTTAELTAIVLDFLDSLGLDRMAYDNKSALFSSNLLSSMEFLALVMYLEKSCGCRIDPLAVSVEKLDTVEAITLFIESAQA